MLTVLLLLYRRATLSRLTVLVVSRQSHASRFPSDRLQRDMLDSWDRVPLFVHSARDGNERRRARVAFTAYVTGSHYANSSTEPPVAWCDAVCDCACSAAAADGIGDASRYYAHSRQQDSLEKWVNGGGLTRCDPSSYRDHRLNHRTVHGATCKSSAGCAPVPGAVPTAAPASADGAIVRSRMDLFRLGYPPGMTARAMIQSGGTARDAASLLIGKTVCDTMIRACCVRERVQPAPPVTGVGSVSRVREFSAALNADYLRRCGTVFCCGSSALLIGRRMQRFEAQLVAACGHDSDLPALVLLYSGNPPGMVLPAAHPLVEFDWCVSSAHANLHVLGVVMSCDSGHALRRLRGVHTLVVAADADCSSAPMLVHAMFQLWRENPGRRLTVHVVGSCTKGSPGAALNELKAAVSADRFVPDFGMPVGWLTVHTHDYSMQQFQAYVADHVSWRHTPDASSICSALQRGRHVGAPEQGQIRESANATLPAPAAQSWDLDSMSASVKSMQAGLASMLRYCSRVTAGLLVFHRGLLEVVTPFVETKRREMDAILAWPDASYPDSARDTEAGGKRAREE